ACGGGVYQSCYNVMGGTDSVIPVDIYVPGCAVKPESVMDAVIQGVGILDEKARKLKVSRRKNRKGAKPGTGAHASVADVEDVPGAGSAGVE
ncbi:MAG: NADH-quinone oxidoreductase subunit B, partial [Coriobacteriales bacterium]